MGYHLFWNAYQLHQWDLDNHGLNEKPDHMTLIRSIVEKKLRAMARCKEILSEDIIFKIMTFPFRSSHYCIRSEVASVTV